MNARTPRVNPICARPQPFDENNYQRIQMARGSLASLAGARPSRERRQHEASHRTAALYLPIELGLFGSIRSATPIELTPNASKPAAVANTANHGLASKHRERARSSPINDEVAAAVSSGPLR